jgi:hypothetical protein
MRKVNRIPLAGPNDQTAYVRDGIAHVRKGIDQRFRNALGEAVVTDANKTTRWYIHRALSKGPSRGGVKETMAHFGTELNVKLALTADIVDGMEIAVPGFKKWLELTGFANDLTMIKGFVAWAEFKNGAGRVIPGVRSAFERG